VAADDAAEVGIFTRDNLPDQIAFDHRQILEDYFTGKY
jgi:ADP-ribose pyrophosphatase YjhB (NUDIX family)